MAAPSSPEDICNLALGDVKQAPINSIATPISSVEYICARNYDAVRREALFAHPWKFAITRIQLTPNPAATPVFGYAYAYNLPTDYIRMVTIGDDAFDTISFRYEIENNMLLALAGDVLLDGTTQNVRYIRDITDVTKFSPGFVTYFRLLLALRMCNAFKVSSTLKKDIRDDFEAVFQEARAVNGQESRIKRIQRSKIISKRRGSQSGTGAGLYTSFGP